MSIDQIIGKLGNSLIKDAVKFHLTRKTEVELELIGIIESANQGLRIARKYLLSAISDEEKLKQLQEEIEPYKFDGKRWDELMEQYKGGRFYDYFVRKREQYFDEDSTVYGGVGTPSIL